MYVLTLEFGSSRCLTRLLYCFTAYGVNAWIIFFPGWGIIFSSPIRVAPPVNTLLIDSSLLSMLSRHCFVDRYFTWLLNLVATDPAWCGNSLILMTSFFLSLPPSKTLLSFLLPTNTTSFFVVLVLVIVLDSILVACSCRPRSRYVLVDMFLYYVDTQEGFSFPVGLGTERTLYQFCDHFFLAKYCFSSPLLLPISMLLSTLLILSSMLVATLLMLVILYID